MTHKNSILELILTDTYRRTSLQDKCLLMYKKNNPFHVTILTQVIIGILDLSQYSPKQFDLQFVKYGIRHIGNSHKNYKSQFVAGFFLKNLSCILEKKVHQCLKIVFTIHVCTSTNNHIAKLNIIYLYVRNSQSNTMCMCIKL